MVTDRIVALVGALLLVPERVYRMEPSCAQRGINTEEQAYADGYAQREQCDLDIYGCFQCRAAEEVLSVHGHCDESSESQPHESASEAKHGGFGYELEEDVAALRAHRLANTDFARSLGYGDEHNVHYADAADQEAYGGDAAEEDGERTDRALDRLQRLLLGGYREVVLFEDAMAQPEDSG